MRVYGINPVIEALGAGRVIALRIAAGPLPDRNRLAGIVRMAGERGIPVRRASAEELERLARGGVHQGVVADVRGGPTTSVEDLVGDGTPLIVVLDQIEDPHNVGAILRTVDAAGAHGVVRQSRHAAPLSACHYRSHGA